MKQKHLLYGTSLCCLALKQVKFVSFIPYKQIMRHLMLQTLSKLFVSKL